MKPGDTIAVKTKKGEYTGVLMPRAGLADEGHIVLKLGSGYNIGIRRGEIVSTKVLESKKSSQSEKKLSFDSKKPKLSIIATGGTITSRVDYKTGGVFPLEKPEELLAGIPELANFASIKPINSPFSILSEDMTPVEWAKIAKEVEKELNSGSNGAIVTHGTDTLHYTAAALSFMLPNLPKPVALVGAQRSGDRGSFDGHQNLLCAAHYCLSEIAEAAVVMHANTDDDYCIASRGTKVRKMHSSRRDAFRPINEAPLAKIFSDGSIIIENTSHRVREDKKAVADTAFEPKIGLVNYYPGASPKLLDFFVKEGHKGVIISGTGFGHVSTAPLDKKNSWVEAIKSASKSGVFVGMTTQTLYGTTDPFVYSAGRILSDAGVVYLKDMLPETAFVKLGWVLGHRGWKPREKMLENIAGEFSERILPETFLA